jgi:transposase InsO family protein
LRRPSTFTLFALSLELAPTQHGHLRGVSTRACRQFVAERPNQRWVGDTTEFVIGRSAKLYLAAIMDLHSRFIVGWAVSAVNDRHLTLRVLDKAVKRRCPDAGPLHHSDQGCTYAVSTIARGSSSTGSPVRRVAGAIATTTP